MFRCLAMVLMSFSLASPAMACWQTPTTDCWQGLARSEALAWVHSGPRLERLAMLIDWGLLPRDAESARALLGDLGPTDLAPDHLSHNRLVFGLYRLVEQTDDAARLRLWYEAIPPVTRRAAGLEPPAGHPDGASAQTERHSRLIQVSAALQQGHPNDAIAALADASGPTEFLGWKELARHAIATGDLALLSSAIRAMQQALDTPPSQAALSPEAQVEALLAAQQDYAQNRDPDALVAVLEQLSMPGFGAQPIPPEAALAPALADLWLRQQGGAGVLPDDALPALIARLQAAETSPDPAITLLSARSALRLGLETEARALVDLAFARSAGMPDPLLKDLPETPQEAPWAALWLDWMLARFQQALHGPAEADPVLMIGLGSPAVDLARALARQGRLDEARRFAAETEAALKPHFPLQAKVAEYLFPPSEAIARISAAQEPSQVPSQGPQNLHTAWRLMMAGQPEAALTLLEAEAQPAGLFPFLGDAVLPDHVLRQRLYALIRDRAPNPNQAQAALLFAARHGDWAEAEPFFAQLAAEPDAPLLRLRALSALAALPQAGIAEVPAFPYEDWAL